MRSEEIKLINKVLKGDNHSFTQLLSNYREPIIKYISTIVSTQEDAEDLSQETFDKCYRYLHRYDSKYAFSTWLFTIAQNTAFDFLRKKRIKPSSLSDVNIDSYNRESVSPAPGPEESLIQNQAIENLIKSIQNLPNIYRRVAYLRFIHEYPLEEISRELDIPLNTVKTRVIRAKKILNEIWKS